MEQQLQPNTMRLNRKSKGLQAQSTLEYAFFIICIVAALVGMQIYLKRSFQGRFREQADSIGRQYDPSNVTSDLHLEVSNSATTTVTLSPGPGQSIRTDTVTDTHSASQVQHGWEQVGGL